MWKRWAVLIVGCPAGSDELETQQRLIADAYECVPDEILQVLEALIERDIESNASNLEFDCSRAIGCWKSDNKFANLLLAKLGALEAKPVQLGVILRALLQHDVCPAYEFARTRMMLPIPTDEERRLAAKAVATALMY